MIEPEWAARSRRENNVPADWVWVTCENLCGDIVWVPPDLPAQTRKVCSAECLHELMSRI